MRRLLLLISAAITPLLIFSCEDGNKQESPIPVISLSGSWYEMGRQYGRQVLPYLQDTRQYLEDRIGNDSQKKEAVELTAEKLFSSYPDSLRVFFDGMREGSGLPLSTLKVLNAIEYAEPDFACAGIAVWGDYSGGELLYGRNYDALSYREISKDIILTIYHPTDSPAFATLGYAGEIYCVNGWNSEGLFIELNNGQPSAGRDYHYELEPSTVSLLMSLGTSKGIDDFDSFITSTRCSSGYMIGVCDSLTARSYEWSYEGCKRGDGSTPEGLMVQTNYFVNPEWSYPTPSDADSWQGHTRRNNLIDLAERHKGSINLETMQKILETCIEDGGATSEYTRYQIIYQPSGNRIWVRIPGELEWSAIDLF
ncbi:MAG: hypothetical protein HUJ89_02215 [Bacteroidales bacterium]|nr:hypothetical protein [Bacteroidales bacterium]